MIKPFLTFLVAFALLLACMSVAICGIVAITQGGGFFITIGIISLLVAATLFICLAQKKIIEYWGNKLYEWLFGK